MFLGRWLRGLESLRLFSNVSGGFFFIFWVEFEKVVRNTRGRGCLGVVGLLVGFGCVQWKLR